MIAQMGSEARSETIVIRDAGDWTHYVSTLRFDGERYQPTSDLRSYGMRLSHAEQDATLFELRGASS